MNTTHIGTANGPVQTNASNSTLQNNQINILEIEKNITAIQNNLTNIESNIAIINNNIDLKIREAKKESIIWITILSIITGLATNWIFEIIKPLLGLTK